ncbi:MAG: hypothetical protein HY370_02475, partial [Proteobacteria bacterium]|nr:hypothetical protein [Pseudomonadota bacterium]
LAKENHMDLSAKDAADKPLEKGKTLFIPVPPEHQIGQITILKNGGGATPGTFALIGATSRLQEKMGATDLPDAATTIRAINQIPERAPDPFVFPGTPLSYPLKDKKGFDVTVVEPLDILRGIAATLTQIADFHDKPGAHKQGTKDIESLMREIARMSGLNYEALKTGDAVIAPGQAMWVNYFNDSITNLKTLPPATKKDGKEVSLIIIEGERDKPDEANYHGKMTMRAAAGTAFSLNPGAGLSNIFRNNEGLLSIGEDFSKTPNIKVNDFAMNAASQSLRLLLGRPDVIFSHSMALSAPQKNFDAFRDSQDDDSIAYAGNRFLIERMMGEYRSPMMSAAGNFRWSSPQVGGFSPEGPYIQDHATMHTPYAVNIGAASISERPGSLGEIVIEDYSSYAGDICAVIPEFQGERESGTSFSTPVFAGIQKEAMERYGESLTAGEIITAAMMVARRNVLDLDYTGGRFEWPKEKPENDISLNGLIALRLLPVPAWFDVNGGGLPHHIRCGAGVLDADGVMKLDLTLKEMKEIKEKNMNGAGAEFEKILSAGAPETRTVRDEKDGKEKKEYVYKISAPENLTLSRLTFFVPQAVRMHSDITVITPAGFKKILPRSHVGGIVSMNAFAIEDVRKGDVFEIYAEQPLGKTAGMILRGWENGGKPDGNVIQIMRDRLRMEGILPAPLTFLVGGKVVESKAKEVELRKLNDLPNVQPLGKNPNETDESGRNSSGPAGSAPSP